MDDSEPLEPDRVWTAREWQKHQLFLKMYGGKPLNLKPQGGQGTGLPNNVDFSSIELRMMEFLRDQQA